MPKNTAPPPDQWESFTYRGRRFFRIPVRLHHDQLVHLTIAQRLADRFDIRHSVARGGGGVIFAATDRHTNRSVIVKVLADYETIRPDGDDGLEWFVESLQRLRHHLQTERRILVQLHRAGCNAVPRVIDYVYDQNPGLEGPHQTESGQSWRFEDQELLDSEPYLVLQQVPGENLQHLLERRYRRGLSQRLALRIIDQVAAVLELLQRPLAMPGGQTWHLVYQDVKPGNVLVDPSGLANILDFGGCQLVIDDTLVLHGSHTPGYCAPECGNGREPIPASADCYGLGTTLFHLLTGINPRRLVPRRAEHNEDRVRAVRIDVGRLRGRCHRSVRELIGRCVAWEPEQRPATVAEFRTLLAPLLQSL